MFLPDGVLIIYAIYIPLAIAIYILELISIYRHWRKSFASSFYQIYSALAVVNIAACLLGSFVFRLNLYPIFVPLYSAMTTNSAWLTGSYSCAYYLNCLSEFLHVLIALNRFTSLCLPLIHDWLWRKAVIVGILACVTVAFAPVWFAFDDPTKFVLRDDLSAPFEYYFVHATANFYTDSIWYNMVVVTAVCNGLCSLLYCFCIIRACMFLRDAMIERNLFLVGFFSTVCSLPYMIGMFLFYRNFSIKDSTVDYTILRVITFQLPWLTDLKYLSPAPLLLVTNKTIRKTIRRMFTRRNSAVSPLRSNYSLDIRSFPG